MMAKRFSSGPPSPANTGAGGGVYRVPNAQGGYLYEQNQPGVSDWGQDAGGRYTSSNVLAQQPPRESPRAALLKEWAQLQQQYPQYTNHVAKLNLDNNMDPGIAGMGGGGALNINNKGLDSWTPEFARFVLAKELGQAVQDRTVATNSRGDQLMNLWNQRTPSSAANRAYGLPYTNWTPATIGKLMQSPTAIDIGGYNTFPTDAYGVQFAAALGQYLPGIAPGSHNLLSGPKLAYAQSIGMVPTPYSRPITPQQPQPNVSDLGRGINRAPTPAVLPAQVNNPLVAQMQQRAAQQNSANAAMRGGPRNF